MWGVVSTHELHVRARHRFGSTGCESHRTGAGASGRETWPTHARGLPASTGARPLPHTRTVPYRDELSANQEHVQRLTRELEETREELAELRAKYARAVLRVVAEGKKIETLLEERKSVPPGSLVPEPKKP